MPLRLPLGRLVHFLLLLNLSPRVQALELAPGLEISLPPTWRTTSQPPATEPAPKQAPDQKLEPSSGTLVLTAATTDPSRSATLSLFRLNFRSLNPPIDGELGLRGEAENALQTVLSLGFQPTAVRTERTPTASNAPLVVVEIIGKGPSGDEWVLTTVAPVVPGGTSPWRLAASRRAADTQAGQEIGQMIHSLKFPDPAGQPNGAHASLLPPANAPTQAAQPSASPDVAQLVSAYSGALVIIEGKQGRGSGFLCSLDGKTFALTNSHVLEANPSAKLTTLNGVELSAGQSDIAVAQDTLRIAIQTMVKPFEILADLDTTARIGDPVVVLGNPEGARVVKPWVGKIVGIGPNLVEVDAPFVGGNSGSPIVHIATGKVIGIATFLIERTMLGQSGELQTDVRRFGYRLDRVKGWQPLDWNRFFTQSRQVGRMAQVSEDFVRMARDARTTGEFAPMNYQSPLVRRPIEAYLRKMNTGSKLSSADEKRLRAGFFSELQQVSRNDIMTFDTRNSYDYFVRKVEEEAKFRDQLYRAFTQMKESVR